MTKSDESWMIYIAVKMSIFGDFFAKRPVHSCVMSSCFYVTHLHLTRALPLTNLSFKYLTLVFNTVSTRASNTHIRLFRHQPILSSCTPPKRKHPPSSPDSSNSSQPTKRQSSGVPSRTFPASSFQGMVSRTKVHGGGPLFLRIHRSLATPV